MHVVFVSCCEKNAIKRTRALLDSYARRTGDQTWLTPITTEGLSELRKALRKTATRQTSVACFRNDGMKRMRLLWTVGNGKKFDKNGISPIATTQKKKRSIMPEWAKTCSLIAETAGFMHDIGKFNQEFQDKLKNKNKFIKDNIRHEWLSMFLAKSLIDGCNWTEAASQLEKRSKKFSDRLNREDTLVFKGQLTSITDALLYCIATHHKLPSIEKGEPTINNDEHVDHNPNKGSFPNPKIPFTPNDKLIKLIQRNIEKLNERQSISSIDNAIYWRAMATFSRMALILADQSISAEAHSPKIVSNATAYANTHNGSLNQDLSWHLENVGYKAKDMVFQMLNIPLPNLSQDAIDQINQSAKGRYIWQNKAALALTSTKNKNNIPHLVLNMAGTGSGKTRMNLRAICALNEDTPVRVATALNLRTLTLQTGDAYHQQAGISKEEMACIIGDSLAQKLHESGLMNVDEDESECSLDVIGDFDFDMPNWLKFYLNKNPKLGDIVGAPILVSTIDFLIAAGEPHRKHHHILAFMRVMHSDLILDEVDGYEPMALLSVLRLVTVSAMFGRNVIASSATLSKPVAKMLWEAYQHGAQMRGLLNQQATSFQTAIIDDLVKPSITSHENVDTFMRDYTAHVEKMMIELKGKIYRKPALARINIKRINIKTDENEWFSTIEKWTKILHEDHAWVDERTGKRLSIGLIRIANVTTAVKVADRLAKNIDNSKITCYHSNHFPMQRFYIEHRLDFLLTRKNSDPNAHIVNDEEIRKILDKADGDVQFIVVATPVEEIGRDHDFDWAIIEPSSSQSIVQTAGRVNRHRLALITSPNIALLQYPYQEMNGEKIAFTKPGLEMIEGKKSTHSSHDLSDLFDWNQLNQIDAKMRFYSDIHPFAKFDDEAIEMKSKNILAAMLTHNHLWMAKETYTESSLRSLEPTIELRLDDPDDAKNYKVLSQESDEEESTRICHLFSYVKNDRDWLVKTDHELIADAQELNIYDKKAMTVSISCLKEDDEKASAFVARKVCRHRSFGFYIE